MLRLIARTLKVLNSETEPLQISLAVALAVVAGLPPFWSPHNLLVLFFVLVLRVNLSAFLLALPLFGALGAALDPVFHRLGLALLSADPLADLWTALYNSVFGRLERINNTVVAGSLVTALAASVPAGLAADRLVRRYRSHLLEAVRRSRLGQVVAASRLCRMYHSVKGWEAGP